MQNRVDKVYTKTINHLLRKYLKKGKLDEFERLAAYADLWGIADDNTRIMQALTVFRNHQLV